jgi:hypothetical protein
MHPVEDDRASFGSVGRVATGIHEAVNRIAKCGQVNLNKLNEPIKCAFVEIGH